MAIGENSFFSSGSEGTNFGSSNSGRRVPEYTYYSRLGLISEDESTKLMFEFRSGLFIPKIYIKSGDNWSQDPVEIVYLSTTKTAMLAEQITKFKEYRANTKKIDESVAFGVTGGMNEKVAFIAFRCKPDKTPMVTIGKFDGSGTITQSHDHIFKVNYNYGLDWKNLEKMDLDKAFYNDIEIDLIHNMVIDFARNMPGGAAYAYHDIGRYDMGRILNKMNPIYEKLGIERLDYNRQPRGTNNFLNNVGNNSFTPSATNTGNSERVSLDDLTDF